MAQICQASVVRKGNRLLMAICDTCGNEYDKAFTVTRADGAHRHVRQHRVRGGGIGAGVRPLRLSHPGPRRGGRRQDLLLRELRPQSRQHRRQRPLSRSGRRTAMKTTTASSGTDSADRPHIRCGRAVQKPGLGHAFRRLGGTYSPAPVAIELGSLETIPEQGSTR